MALKHFDEHKPLKIKEEWDWELTVFESCSPFCWSVISKKSIGWNIVRVTGFWGETESEIGRHHAHVLWTKKSSLIILSFFMWNCNFFFRNLCTYQLQRWNIIHCEFKSKTIHRIQTSFFGIFVLQNVPISQELKFLRENTTK